MANVKALIKFRDILTEVINVLIRLDNYHFPTPSIVALKKYLTDIETYCQPADIIADIVQNDNYLQNKKIYLLPLEGLFKCDFGIGVISCNNVVYDFWDGLNERLEKDGFKDCDIVEYTNLVQRIIYSIEDCLSGLKSDFSHIGIIEKPTDEGLSSVVLPDKLDTDDAKRLFSEAIKDNLMYIEGDKYVWCKSNALLAYFCGRIYCGDTLIKEKVTGELVVKRNSTIFPESALMSLFYNKDGCPIRNLGQSRLQLHYPPKEHETVDILFEKAAD